MYRFGYYAFIIYEAARAALHLSLSSDSGWPSAGTVSSDGGVIESATPAPAKTPEPAVSQVQTKLADALPDFDDLGSAEIKGPEIKIGKNRFNLFKTKCKMSLPIFDNKNLRIKVNETDHTAEVLLGMEGLLDYIDGKEPEDDFTRKLNEAVQSVRKNEKWRVLDIRWMSVKHGPERRGDRLYDSADEIPGEI